MHDVEMAMRSTLHSWSDALTSAERQDYSRVPQCCKTGAQAFLTTAESAALGCPSLDHQQSRIPCSA